MAHALLSKPRPYQEEGPDYSRVPDKDRVKDKLVRRLQKLGYAVTVTMDSQPGAVASREGYWKMWRALEQAPKPAVVVVQDVSGAPTRCAYFGEVMATLAQRLGAVGVVTDGGIRDLDEVHALGLHYFAPFAVVSHGNFEIVDVGQPVTIDGQVIRPGDLLHGDANGIVVVPPELAADLPKAIESIRQTEAERIGYIKGPDFNLDDLVKLLEGADSTY